MHTVLITNEDGQRTQVGPDPLDDVVRYAVTDHDCYPRAVHREPRYAPQSH